MIRESDERKGVFCISGNTYIFLPKATRHFLDTPEKEQEFRSKFLKKHPHIRYDLNIIFPDHGKDARKLKGFSQRLAVTL